MIKQHIEIYLDSTMCVVDIGVERKYSCQLVMVSSTNTPLTVLLNPIGSKILIKLAPENFNATTEAIAVTISNIKRNKFI